MVRDGQAVTVLTRRARGSTGVKRTRAFRDIRPLFRATSRQLLTICLSSVCCLNGAFDALAYLVTSETCRTPGSELAPGSSRQDVQSSHIGGYSFLLLHYLEYGSLSVFSLAGLPDVPGSPVTHAAWQVRHLARVRG